jgi:hypothetical protein
MAVTEVLKCNHKTASDPRLENICVKCGRFVLTDTMERDPAFELAVLRDAAERVGLPHLADSLHKFADSRVEPGPIRLAEGRDLVKEWLEEVADGVGNYGPWELQRMIRDGVEDDHRAAYLQEALAHGLLMYAALHKARSED